MTQLPGVAEVVVSTRRGEFRAMLDPAAYRGQAARPVDLHGLARSQGPDAALTCALVGLSARGLTPARVAELAAYASCYRNGSDVRPDAHPDALPEALTAELPPDVRTAVQLLPELVTGPVSPEAFRCAAASSAKVLDLDQCWVPALMVLALCVPIPNAVPVYALIDDSTPPLLLTALAGSTSSYIRELVAGCTGTPPEVVFKLAGDPDRDVVCTVAERRDLSRELSNRFAYSNHSAVRVAVAGNSSFPASVLTGDHVVEVRRALAGNPSCPPPALASLVSDPDVVTATVAQRNPALPAHILDALARSGVLEERVNAAHNPGTSPDLLVTLASDVEPRVRCAVAQNPSTPAGTLATFVSDAERSVRLAAHGPLTKRSPH